MKIFKYYKMTKCVINEIFWCFCMESKFRNEGFVTLQIHKEAKSQIEYLAKLLNKPQCTFLDELIYQMFVLGASYKSANVKYESRVTSGELIVNFYGDSRLVSGHFPCKGMTERQIELKTNEETENAFNSGKEQK